MPDYMIEADNIHDIDFGKRIEAAINSQDYRNAVRLLYLFALRQLSEKDLIKWKLNKTNQEYWKELKNKGLGESFSEITYFFEWVWYGHFDISGEKFKEIQSLFQKFGQRIA